MTYPLPLFAQRVARYQYAFIELPQREIDYIGNKYVASKFLRIGSYIGYSVGRFLDIQDNGETVEINEISIEELCERMEQEFKKMEWLYIALRNFPDLEKEFILEFK